MVNSIHATKLILFLNNKPNANRQNTALSFKNGYEFRLLWHGTKNYSACRILDRARVVVVSCYYMPRDALPVGGIRVSGRYG